MLWAVERDCIILSCIYTIYAINFLTSVWKHLVAQKMQTYRGNIYGLFHNTQQKWEGGDAKFEHEKLKHREKKSCSKFK
jgi:hypothetical protein